MSVLFFQGDRVCEVSYADRQGKYMGQKEITMRNCKLHHLHILRIFIIPAPSACYHYC